MTENDVIARRQSGLSAGGVQADAQWLLLPPTDHPNVSGDDEMKEIEGNGYFMWLFSRYPFAG